MTKTLPYYVLQAGKLLQLEVGHTLSNIVHLEGKDSRQSVHMGMGNESGRGLGQILISEMWRSPG